MDAKHTPGPWFVGASTGPNCARIETENGAQVAAVNVQSFVTVKQGQPVYEWSDEGYANALLIAAAPETAAERDRLKEINAELIEALVKAKQWHQGDQWRDYDDDANKAAWEMQMNVINDAIAKATE